MSRRVCLLLAAVAAAAPARALAAPTGLDAIDDSVLRDELAKRNLPGLLQRSFDNDRVPQGQRDAITARIDLLRLRDAASPDLTAARRAVARYVAALPTILAATNDPAALIGDANLLIDQGVAADQSLLEYFGPAPAAMNRLRPVAAAARQLLEKAAASADAVCTKALDDWPATESVWDRADQQKTIAVYTRAILAYPLALATDPADATRDKTLADALARLAPYDTPDNPDLASVRFYAAKLNLARNTAASLNAAADGFAYAIDKGKPDDVRQQFDARLLTCSVRLAQRRIPDARAALDAFAAWAKSAGLDAAQIDVAAAAARYRIALAQSDDSAAADVLDALQQKRPELRGLVLELVAAHTDAAAPVAGLSPLQLQALLARAESETLKPAGQSFDQPAVARGVDAARSLIAREPTSPRADAAAYVLPFLLAKLDKNADAAAAFLDYVDAHKAAGKTDRLTTAFDQAVASVAALSRSAPDDPAVTKLYDRTLATAFAPPLERREFAYEYGRRLQAAGKPDAAIAAYRAVPENDRNYGESRYYLMVALRQKLAALPAADPARPAALAEVESLIDTVDRTTQERLSANPTPQAAQTDRTRLAQTRLLGADLALTGKKDAARAVALLDGFEAVAANLPNAADLLGQALLVRVQAYVALGDVGRATDQLVQLAQRDPAGAGQVVYNLLKTLDAQVTQAEAANHTDDVSRLERDRAMLTPFLVNWAETHPDERVRKLTYTYRVFDADTQRRAALGTADPAERAKLLDAALKRFTELSDDTNVRRYLEALPPAESTALAYDPQVKFGLARTLYAQGQWSAARQELATLFRDKALGSPTTTQLDAAGTATSQENPSYWEALLDLIRCNLRLNENVDAMRGLLAEQHVLYGQQVGGDRWKTEFALLDNELR